MGLFPEVLSMSDSGSEDIQTEEMNQGSDLDLLVKFSNEWSGLLVK